MLLVFVVFFFFFFFFFFEEVNVRVGVLGDRLVLGLRWMEMGFFMGK